MKLLSSLAPLACALGLLLSACAEEPEYRLRQVLPAGVTPGETVTAYGTFPPKAVLSLGGVTLEATPVPGGLRFTVPERFVAGQHPLQIVQGHTTLSGSLQVRPRIDGAVLAGKTLRVSGAGWPSRSEEFERVAVRLELDGVKLVPRLEGEALAYPLSPATAYGVAQLKVWAGGEVSEAYPLLREAGAARGWVELPAGPAAGARPMSLPAPTADPRALLVYHRAGALEGLVLTGLRERQSEPRLGASRLVFAEPEAAQRARGLLRKHPGVYRVEGDQPVLPQGSRAIYVRGPALSVRPMDSTPRPPAEQWHLPRMGLSAAWERTQGEGIVVAVVDTGVMLTHPDLRANLLPGYDFVDDDAVPDDTYGHGTHVAGLVAASGKVYGAAPQAQLLPVRVIRDFAGGSAFTVAQGILWAAGLLSDPPNPHPAQVINLSLGLEGGSPLIEAAVRQALAAGVTVVAAAGNAGVAALASPASVPGVVAVTALSGPKLVYPVWYANYGAGLQLSAYGGDTASDQDGDGVPDGLLSTDRNPDGSPGYGLRMGTSMAAPLVSGLAALALSSGTPAGLVRETLAATATDLGVQGYDERYGYGLATGRTATASSPRTYLLALDGGGKVLGWTLVQGDQTFLLGNLPPGEPLTLWAASDLDGDRRLGEGGELVSALLPFVATAGQVSDLPPLGLTPSDGHAPLELADFRP